MLVCESELLHFLFTPFTTIYSIYQCAGQGCIALLALSFLLSHLLLIPLFICSYSLSYSNGLQTFIFWLWIYKLYISCNKKWFFNEVFVLWASALAKGDDTSLPQSSLLSLCTHTHTHTAETSLYFWTLLVFQLAVVICRPQLLGAQMTPQSTLSPDSSH